MMRIKLNEAVTLNCTGSLGLRLGITQNLKLKTIKLVLPLWCRGY